MGVPGRLLRLDGRRPRDAAGAAPRVARRATGSPAPCWWSRSASRASGSRSSPGPWSRSRPARAGARGSTSSPSRSSSTASGGWAGDTRPPATPRSRTSPTRRSTCSTRSRRRSPRCSAWRRRATRSAVGAYDWGRVLAVAAIGLAGWRLVRLGSVPRWLWVVAAIAFSFWLLSAFNQIPDRQPNSSRYQYIGGIFVILIAAELLRGVRPRPAALAVAAAVVLLAVLSGISYLNQSAKSYDATSDLIGADLAALELARDTVQPGFMLRNRDRRDRLRPRHRRRVPVGRRRLRLSGRHARGAGGGARAGADGGRPGAGCGARPRGPAGDRAGAGCAQDRPRRGAGRGRAAAGRRGRRGHSRVDGRPAPGALRDRELPDRGGRGARRRADDDRDPARPLLGSVAPAGTGSGSIALCSGGGG